MLSDFYKEKDTDKIWRVDDLDTVGKVLFSFDKKKVYNAFDDYPYNMAKSEIAIFDKEMPFWAEFFKWRRKA